MISVQSLSKSYGATRALDDVSFDCRSGQVTGFLGPNGAGKSTAMRVMVGLTPASAGGVTIGGRRYADLPNPGRHVGVLLDASAQHPGRTGREVLALGALTMGVPASRVEEMLALVGLTPAEAKQRVRNYSLGMRQRLGIAFALLGDPPVLVLDEPANGLDPAGIHWMRGLLREHAARGGTVLLSSHLLHEVERVADELVLIGRGRIVAQGSKQALLSPAGGFVRAVDADRLATALVGAGVQVTPVDGGLRTDAAPERVGRIAAEAGLALVELRPAQSSGLEDLFLELTADVQRDGRHDGRPDGPAVPAGGLNRDLNRDSNREGAVA